MGLDMYLNRARKVKGWDADDYGRLENALCELPIGIIPDDLTELGVKLELPEINQVVGDLHLYGNYISWYTIEDRVMYWRKANHIHNWFVDRVQGGLDECEPFLVSKNQLESLREACQESIDRPDEADAILPTVGGFFFGGTEYDDWYFEETKKTIDAIDKILAETDFDKQVLIYQASW